MTHKEFSRKKAAAAWWFAQVCCLTLMVGLLNFTEMPTKWMIIGLVVTGVFIITYALWLDQKNNKAFSEESYEEYLVKYIDKVRNESNTSFENLRKQCKKEKDEAERKIEMYKQIQKNLVSEDKNANQLPLTIMSIKVNDSHGHMLVACDKFEAEDMLKNLNLDIRTVTVEHTGEERKATVLDVKGAELALFRILKEKKF